MTYYFIGKREKDIQGAFFYLHKEDALKDLDLYRGERQFALAELFGEQIDNYQDEFKLFEVEVN